MASQWAIELMRNLHFCLSGNGQKEKDLYVFEETSPE